MSAGYVAWIGSVPAIDLGFAPFPLARSARLRSSMRRSPAGCGGLRPTARYSAGVAALLVMAACLPTTLWLLPPPRETPTPATCTETSADVSPAVAAVDNVPAAVNRRHSDESNNAIVVKQRMPPIVSNDTPFEPVATDYTEYAVAAITTSSPYVAAIYLTGVLAMLLRVAVGLWSGRRLARPASRSPTTLS